MEISMALGAEVVTAEQVVFCRQEQAKLKTALKALERGTSRQRAWNRGQAI
jgi:hypothetical protein